MDVPERIGPYEIVRELGRGGMAIVYLAREPDENTLIALKVLPDTWADDPSRLDRFHREAATVMKVRHPNIVPVYSVGSARGVRFIAMKLIEGTSLDKLIRAQVVSRASVRNDRTVVLAKGQPAGAESVTTVIDRHEALERSEAPISGPPISWVRESPREELGPPISRLPETSAPKHPAVSALSEPEWVYRAVVIVETIARALHHVHEQGIVHRDVKPGNIIVDAFGDAWLADFGLVRDLEAPNPEDSQGLLGTVQYISPEQIIGGEARSDRRSDLYALGVTLYELVTLRRPFDGGDATSILAAAVDEEPLPPRRINPKLTEGLERVIRKAMAKDPKARYQSGEALADDLCRLRTLQSPEASGSKFVARLRKIGGQSPMTRAALAFLVCLVLGLGGYCVHDALRERQRLFECRTEADQAFDRGDLGGAADGYQLYLKLGGADAAVLQRLQFCKDAAALASPK